MFADESVRAMSNFVVGANKKDAHLANVNMGRDFDVSEFGDFRVITANDPCPSCGSPITIEHAIEIGHTFKLGTKYSAALGAKYLDKDGKEKFAIMGCYGIGVNRIVASLIESSNDKDGIIWPAAIAPYRVVIIALAIDDENIRKTADGLYDQLTKAGYDVLYDDRAESPGKKFKDADLIGFPIQIVVSERNLKNNGVEIKVRETGKRHVISLPEVEAHLKNYF
jgi:prolyl-tRNA synthetase